MRFSKYHHMVETLPPDRANQAFRPAYAGNADRNAAISRQQSVHPRIRGERARRGRSTGSCNGSSPHTRGTPSTTRPDGARGRFIPAYAGNAAGGNGNAPATAVHPRIHGERLWRLDKPAWITGSSPRARGTLTKRCRRWFRVRFIPACAGNACAAVARPRFSPVHPRVRGERDPNEVRQVQADGSSPRARGTHTSARCRACSWRFIPACAGNALENARPVGVVSVHPRVRGERPPQKRQTLASIGSSPRARGTLMPLLILFTMWRFIPACAGNAPTARPGSPISTVHPRVRGERPDRDCRRRHVVGSSPRARGTRLFELVHGHVSWFIPACAGNASDGRYKSGKRAVHPRVRGERSPLAIEADGTVGSSPRARGTQPNLPVPDRPRRFIPACAGNAQTHGSTPSMASVHPRVRGERDFGQAVGVVGCGSSPRARGTLFLTIPN